MLAIFFANTHTHSAINNKNDFRKKFQKREEILRKKSCNRKFTESCVLISSCFAQEEPECNLLRQKKELPSPARHSDIQLKVQLDDTETSESSKQCG